MAIDTPATVAILGAGPIGIEAALYARYLGYDVLVLEQDNVAACLRAQADLPVPGRFRELSTPLGLAALQAQDPDYKPPAPDAVLTGQQWIEQYLKPLADTDLVADHLHCGVTALEITIIPAVQQAGRAADVATTEEPTDGQDTDEADEDLDDTLRDRFQIAVREFEGSESTRTADIVMDITGRHDENSQLLGKLGVAFHAATGGPEAMGAWLALRDPAGPIAPADAQRVVTNIRHFYILGRKSYGRDGRFTMTDGYRQIRDVFSIIGGRAGLDLYATLR